MRTREERLEQLVCELYSYIVFVALAQREHLNIDERLSDEQKDLLTDVITTKYPAPKLTDTISVN